MPNEQVAASACLFLPLLLITAASVFAGGLTVHVLIIAGGLLMFLALDVVHTF